MNFTTTSTPIRSEFGVMRLHAFEYPTHTHSALCTDYLDTNQRPLVRVQSSCLTGTAFHSLLCDCRQQLHIAMRLVSDDPAGGCVLYLDQEGRGHGLAEKVAQLALIAEGMDTFDAAAARGVEADRRNWDEAAEILAYLVGQAPIRLLTNNPLKAAGLSKAGVIVADELAIQAPVTEWNSSYLSSKRDKMGHKLSL